MRIIYIHQYFTTPDMVGGTRSFEFARRFVDWGHEVTVVSAWTHPVARQGWFETHETGARVLWYPVSYSNAMSFKQRLRAFGKFAAAARVRASKTLADVVFATSTPLTVSIPGVSAARSNRVPLVFEVRDLWPTVPIALGALSNPAMRWAATRMERWAYRNSEAVIALSPGIRDGIASTGYPRNRIAVIPNSCDIDAFTESDASREAFRQSRPWLGDRPLIVYAGALGRANGVSDLIEIASELSDMVPEARILIIGDGSERDALRDLARSRRVLDRTLFMEPAMPKKDVLAAFTAADLTMCLFVDVEALWTGSPNKLFDSLAAGTPVFINYGGWQADLLHKSGAGIVSVRESAPSAAARIADFLHDDDRRIVAGSRARSLASEVFNRNDHAQQVMHVLQAAVDGQGQAASSVSPHWT